jgi:SAM-dependent methyltransferase
VNQEQTIEDLLARLERERLEADRQYNAALTAVDRALQSVPELPVTPAAYDPVRLAELNDGWNILPGGPPPVDRSLKGRLRSFVWRVVAPPIEAQQRFNAALVDHLNRNVRSHEETARGVAAVLQALQREMTALVRFESLLIQSLQTITAYVDTKDRSVGGPEIRQRLARTEERLLALKRQVESGSEGESSRAQTAPAHPSEPAGRGAPRDTLFATPVDAQTYVRFEDEFRGEKSEISGRVEQYLPLLAAATDVVDIGCGRGELLSLLNERGITARGVDTNAAMVEACRRRGLNVEQGDAVGFLARQHDGSIGALVAIQVVEHMPAAYLAMFLEQAFHKMRPGAPLVLETINPACWMAFFETYIRDLTHQHPLHPDTLRFLVQSAGFSHVDVRFRAPVSADDRLVHIDAHAAGAGSDSGLRQVAAALNDHADKLNRRLFSYMDYVVVARR